MDDMTEGYTTIELSRSELREVAAYAVECARPALVIFERERPDDRRPRAAIDAGQTFADGAERTKTLRDSAWAALRAAQEARDAGQALSERSAEEAATALWTGRGPMPRDRRSRLCASRGELVASDSAARLSEDSALLAASYLGELSR
jgi:hypothetical protein